jgi:superfamily II DNA or RNA helicase
MQETTLTLTASDLIESGAKYIYSNIIDSNPDKYNYYYNQCSKQYSKYLEITGLDYREYQLKYAAMLCIRNRHILGYSQGAGKTLTALLAAFTIYKDLKLPYQIHIVVPNTLAVFRWISEFNRYKLEEGVDFLYLSTKTSFQDITNLPKVHILLYMYSTLTLNRIVNSDNCTNAKPLFKIIRRYLRPSLIIADEIHCLSNENSKRYTALQYLLRITKRVIGLTGTISDGNLGQLNTVCKLIYGDHWPYQNNGTFISKFSRKTKIQGHYLKGADAVGNKMLNYLDFTNISSYFKLINRFIHRMNLTHPEIFSLIVLPTIKEYVHIVQPSAELRTNYTEFINKNRQVFTQVSNLKSNNVKVISLLAPLISIVNFHSQSKLSKVKEIIKSYSKTVIFCDRVNSARLLHSEIEDSIRIYASDEFASPKTLNEEQKWERLQQYITNPKYKVGVFSINILSESIDLINTEAIIFYCLPWQSIKVQQAISRVVRPGNLNKNVDIHFIAHQGLIDQYQLMLVKEKIKISQMLLDYDELFGESNETIEVTSVVKEILKSN